MTIEMIPSAPFDFARMLRRQTSTGKNKITWIDLEQLSFKRIIRFNGKLVLLKIRSIGDVDHPKMLLDIPSSLQEHERDTFVKLVRLVFSMDVDLVSFYQHFQEHPQLMPVLNRFKGLRMVLEPDLFETMAKTIISQQLNLSFAATLIDRLIALAGEEVEVEGERFAVFPSAESVAKLSYQTLRELSFSQRKAEYLIDFARAVVDGKIDLDALWKMSDEEVMQTLLPLRGIGKWSIECLLMFGMGRCDLLPAADIGLRNAIKKAWNLSSQPTEQEVRTIGANWSPWKSYATYYLWESLAD